VAPAVRLDDRADLLDILASRLELAHFLGKQRHSPRLDARPPKRVVLERDDKREIATKPIELTELESGFNLG
jgi:hypothetical protein